MSAVFDLLHYGCTVAVTGPCRGQAVRVKWNPRLEANPWKKETVLGESRSVEAEVDEKMLMNHKQDAEANSQSRSKDYDAEVHRGKKWEGDRRIFGRRRLGTSEISCPSTRIIARRSPPASMVS